MLTKCYYAQNNASIFYSGLSVVQLFVKAFSTGAEVFRLCLVQVLRSSGCVWCAFSTHLEMLQLLHDQPLLSPPIPAIAMEAPWVLASSCTLAALEWTLVSPSAPHVPHNTHIHTHTHTHTQCHVCHVTAQ